LFILCCSLYFTAHILVTDHFAKNADPIKLSSIQFAVVAVLSAIFAWLFEDPSWAKIVSAIKPILFCGVLSCGVAYTGQVVGQKLTDPTSASLIMSLESVFAAVFGAIILREQMSSKEIIGCIIMFAAIILVQIPFPERSKDVRR